ncbi:hypothetical protein QQS21_007269 [Conoideocrella luteorostrata]|uniref:Zn(2)-C6 fungal-type domain-containing protein n=1 Tax=Conoideocrella luteorostrata TaxID=1105319 RepID=A0AAJ0CLE7_9HYPO|nr:hypothetical protein QQS21_007269 [Conoideocrella luteorostrata]
MKEAGAHPFYLRAQSDEKKPSCTSCQSRSVTCAYPDLQFIPKSTIGDEAPSRTSSYSRIKVCTPTFLFTASLPSLPSPRLLDETHGSHEYKFVNEPLSPVSKSGDKSSQSGSPALPATQLDVRGGGNAYPGSSSSITIDSLLTTTLLNEPRKKERPLVDWDGYFDTDSVSEGRRHAALLRHFRYKMVPWMEAGNPASQFGVDVMFLAQENPEIQAVIIEIASERLGLLRETKESGGPRRRSEMRRHSLQEPVKVLTDSLLATSAYLHCGPLKWRDSASPELQELNSDMSASDIDEPLQTLCKLHSRFDLASSLLLRRAPLTSSSFYAPGANPVAWDTESPTASHNWSLYHLTICLHFIHDPTQSFAHQLLQTSSRNAGPPLSSYPQVSAKWMALWESCQIWRGRRPLPMRPIVDIGNIEAGQIDTQADASFPIQVYTNALAIQSNILYHITSLLLLLNKPRLLKLTGYQASHVSQSWHAQSIAGIACTNDFAEQWDPILVAALLLIARDLTHASQQSALMTCLQKVTAGTGLRLEREVEELQEHWRTGRLL